tara:strand:+ start:280 stop:426 length:147 start_codon:yes stop_codon:yes gene_type:complete
MKRSRIVYYINKLKDKKNYVHLILNSKDRKIENIISNICRKYEKELKI